MSRLSEVGNLRFVELYCSHKCLWNMTPVMYKDRAKEMRKSDLAVSKEVANKIKNIHSTHISTSYPLMYPTYFLLFVNFDNSKCNNSFTIKTPSFINDSIFFTEHFSECYI
jgi:hypothetical protein